MNILRLILQNLRQGTASYQLPHTHECTSNEYRGLIKNDPAGCIGCGACAYVCPTAAIVVTRTPTNYTWSYEPGKCTFCGRCIDRCKPGSLSMESKLPPLYSNDGEEEARAASGSGRCRCRCCCNAGRRAHGRKACCRTGCRCSDSEPRGLTEKRTQEDLWQPQPLILKSS
jgi:formate hydrogenlyase subunit 6/NADH:ubiquinone oxidoreductase subunit I